MGGAVWQKYMKMARQMSLPVRVEEYWNNLTVTERQSVLFLDEADLVKQLYKLNFSLLCVGLMQRRLKKASSSSADEPTYELLEAMEFMDIGTGIMTVKNELVQDGHASALFELIQSSLHGFLTQPHVLSDKDFTQLFFHDSEGVSSWDEYQNLIAMLLEQLIVKSFVAHLERESLRQMEALLQEVDQETKQEVKAGTTKKRKKRRKHATSPPPAPQNHATVDAAHQDHDAELQFTPTTPTKKYIPPTLAGPLTPPAAAQPLQTAPQSPPASHLSPKKVPTSTASAHLSSTPRTLNPSAAEFKPLLPLKRKFDSFVVQVDNTDEDDDDDLQGKEHGDYHGWRRRSRTDCDDDDGDDQRMDASRDAELDAQLAQLYHVTSELFGWNFTHHCEYTGAYDGWNESGFFMAQHHPVVRFFSSDCNLCTNLTRCRRHQAEEDAWVWRQRALHDPSPVQGYHDRFYR